MKQRRRVMITGAASGIGEALARRYAQQGAELALVDTNLEGLERLERELGSGRAFARRLDVSDRADVALAVSEIDERLGAVDTLVNAAGIGIYAKVEDTPIDRWERILAVNLFGTLYTTLTVLPQMLRRRSGQIVNIASMQGVLAVPFAVPYCTSKFGVVAFTRGLRAEVRHQGVDVLLVNPGVVRTAFARHATAGTVRIFGRDVPITESFLERVMSSGFGVDAAEVADSILDASGRRSAEVTIGLDAKVLTRIAGVFPRSAQRILEVLVG